MSSGKKIFFNLVAKVEALDTFKEILRKEITRYFLIPGKTEWMEIPMIQNLYESVELKNHFVNIESMDSEIWSDNQKKLFIWFIIFYTYFLELEGKSINSETWPLLSTVFFEKHPRFLHFQYLNLIKPSGKISWTIEEDALLSEAVAATGQGKWNEVARYFFYQSNLQMFKSPKHCRERWLNHLDDKKKHGNWTAEEDLAIFQYVAEFGKKWCKLVAILKDTRTEHMIKNRFNSLMTKMKASKKEREESMIQKMIRQLKKQIANIEKRKQKKEEKDRLAREHQSEVKETVAVKEEFVEQYNEQYFDEVEKHQESHQKPSLPSHESSLKKQDTDAKDHSSKEIEVEVKAEAMEDNIMIPIAQPAQPIAPLLHLENNLCKYLSPWHHRQMEMMPYVMPFGYYGPY